MKRFIQEKRFLPVVIAVIIVAAAGYLAFRWHQGEIAAAVKRQKMAAQAESDALKEKIIGLEEELRQQSGAPVSEERLFEVFGKDAVLLSPGQKVNCEILERQMSAFFRYLDQREYIKPYKLRKGTAGLYREMLTQLAAAPPTIVGETRDLFTLIRNMAHLNRVLDKNRIKLIKEMLAAEADIVEPTMATFYAWFTHDDGCRSSEINRPSLETLYEYAGFFLNTLSGRSYLFRRNSTVRTLANYYCVLIIDRANTKTLNPYGIDIGQSLDSLAYELDNGKGLLHRKLYFTELEKLQRKYQLQKQNTIESFMKLPG